MEKLSQYLKDPFRILSGVLRRMAPWISNDELYLRILFFLKQRKFLHLKNPQTFSEKLQWLKLHDRKPEYTTMVDKYAVKEYVANIIGEEYIIPTIGVWDKPEDIDWDSLPDKFVLKTTHGGGNTGVVVCKDKNQLDKSDTIKKLNKSMKQDLYKSQREWPYKNVQKKIIAEVYMEDVKTKELRDYKFFAFNGIVKALFIATERGSGNVKFDFFDANFNHLDLIQQHPMSGVEIPKPSCFDQMKDIASKLSVGLPHVRVDLYEVNGKVYFGEFTFSHHGGVVPFHPKEWDFKFGSWIQLPEISKP